MKPQTETPQPPIRASRDCPVCGTPVHWTRYWLRSWTWAKWPCKKCDTLLAFDRRRRLLVIPLIVPVLIIYALLLAQYSLMVALPFLLLGTVAAGFIDRVKVVGHRNPQYCPACRYNLTGSLEAGLDRCPECGRLIDQIGSSGTRGHSE